MWIGFLLVTGVIGVCIVAMTAGFLSTARDAREFFRAARHTFAQAQQLLKRTQGATDEVATVVEKTCHVTSDVLDQVTHFKTKAQAFLAQFGNGTKAGSRRYHRKS